MGLGSIIYILEKPMPIDVRHHVRFHVVHDFSFLALINGECLQWLSVVIKLSQNNCIVARNQGA